MEYNKRKIPFERRCEIGERLRKFRDSKGLTQDQMAEILGISKSFYGQAERGNSSLGEYRLLVLSDELNADIGYILTGKKFYFVEAFNTYMSVPEDKVEAVAQMAKLVTEIL